MKTEAVQNQNGTECEIAVLDGATGYWLVASKMVFYQDDEKGGWSIHLEGTTTSECEAGIGVLARGTSEWDNEEGEWARPNHDDRQGAFRRFLLYLRKYKVVDKMTEEKNENHSA